MRLFKINNPVNIDVLPRRIVTRSLLVIITNIAFLSCFITLVKLKSYITIRSEIKSDRYENFVIIANKSGLVNIPKFGLSASISKNECLGIYELSDHTFPKADQYQTLTDLNLARCLTHTDSTINKLKALIINDESINYFVTRLLNNLLYYQSMYNVNAASYSKLVDSYLENQTTNLEIQNLIRTKDSLESALKNLLASSDVRDASLKNQSVISTQYREERLIENIKDKVNSLSREINDYAITTNNYDVNKDFLLRELEFQNKFRNMVNDIELSIFEVKNAELEWKRKYFIIAPQSGYLHLGNYSSLSYFEPGDTIAIISPPADSTSDFEVHFRFPSKYINYLHQGQTVYSELDEFPYLEYGSLTATVTDISSIPFGDAYICKAKLSNAFVTTYGVSIAPLGSNLPARSRVMIKKESLFEKFQKGMRWKVTNLTSNNTTQEQ
ncbi:MAG TPA: HlyD family efflux transporter periplasmic adaptor subunit [Saprospiraceae bacterium]|nr:HlyD family efflux transporter periplasmic adaptor subunit [Saprospiraceae bacterium]HPG06911.1 HlyD family efflux transporter periplasmic adaptor subunit [Saprospiraceae bacterium]HRV85149.1 HlyD family efflux transporter periplasmic adaptor subunit [Saprospiraceae bacterium]